MIDLTKKSLPDYIEIDGRDYLIETDFRKWLKFYKLYFLEKDSNLFDYFFLFKDRKNVPILNFIPALVHFFVNENITPKTSGNSSSERVFCYIEDGEFIVASFMRDYGIDLTNPNLEMHWHLFKALFEGLSDDTKIKQIIGYRSYVKSNKKIEKVYEELKSMWSLPTIPKQEEDEVMDEINKLFYDS